MCRFCSNKPSRASVNILLHPVRPVHYKLRSYFLNFFYEIYNWCSDLNKDISLWAGINWIVSGGLMPATVTVIKCFAHSKPSWSLLTSFTQKWSLTFILCPPSSFYSSRKAERLHRCKVFITARHWRQTGLTLILFIYLCHGAFRDPWAKASRSPLQEQSIYRNTNTLNRTAIVANGRFLHVC